MHWLLASFTAHFFEGADAAIQDYVAGVLTEAAGDGSAAADVSNSIEAFRGPGIPQPAFEQAVAEVLAGLRGPGSPWPPSWETAATASELASGTNGSPQLSTTAGGSQPSDCASAPAAAEAAAPSKAGLSIHAPSFQPSSSGANAAAAAAAEALGGLSLSGQQEGVAEADADPPWADGDTLEGDEAAPGWDGGPDGYGCEDRGGWEADQPGQSWYAEDEAGWMAAEPQQWGAVEQQQHQHGQHYGSHYSPASSSAGGWGQQQQQGQGQGQQAEQAHRLVAGSAEQGAFLSVLSQQFPEYSPPSLAALLEQQGGSLEATVDVLCSLESELQGQTALNVGLGPGGLGSPPQREQQQAAPAFEDDDFPSLTPAGSTPPTSPSPAPSALTSMPYAAAAKASGASPAAAARQPRPRPSSSSSSSAQRAAGASSTGSAAASARAPIWEAQGVPQFATGAQVAAEYAAAREEARDHARLRNQYFQQATRAYLAGQRQLARELGIKGRWHGQQMRAAHSAASDRIFAQRNQGAAIATAAAAGPAAPRPGRTPRPGTAGGGGSQQQQAQGAGAVQTIDLHGLHVSEALERLESTLLGLSQQPSSAPAARAGWGSPAGRPPPRRQLRLVVGVGQHSKVPSRLPQAVRRYLEDQGLAVSEPYAGLLEVVLP